MADTASTIPLAQPDPNDPNAVKPKAPAAPTATNANTIPLAGPAQTAVPQSNTQTTVTTPPAAQGMIPLAAQVPQTPTGAPDRIALATNAWDTFAKSTDPQFAHDLNLTTQTAAGAGRLGSGMLRTSLGDLANQRALALDTEKQSLINSAVTGSIGDTQEQQRLELARATGLGGLDVAKGQLALAKTGQEQQYGLAQRQVGLSEQLGLGNLSLEQARTALDEKVRTGQLTIEQANQALAEKQNSQQFGMAEKQFGLSEKLGLGNLSLAQAQQALDEKVKTGELTLDQARQALAEHQTQIQQQQFTDQLKQAMTVATMGDKTANRGIDTQAALAQNDLWLKIANLLATMGFPKTGTAGGGGGGSSGGGSGNSGGGSSSGSGTPTSDPYTGLTE